MDLSLNTVKEEVEERPEEEEEQPYTPRSRILPTRRCSRTMAPLTSEASPRPRPTQILQRPSSRSVLSGRTPPPASGRMLTLAAETPEFKPSRPNLQLAIPSSTPIPLTLPRPHSPMSVIPESPSQRSSHTTAVAGSQGGAPPQEPQSSPEPYTPPQPYPAISPTEDSTSQPSAGTTIVAVTRDRSTPPRPRPEGSPPQQSGSTTPRIDFVGRTPPRQPRAFQVSHTNSHTWLDNRLVERERWKEIERNLIRMRFIDPVKRAIVPQTFQRYMDLRRYRAEGLAKREARRLAQRNPPNVWPLSGLAPVKIGPAFGGKRFDDRRSAVLAQPTIWRQQYVPSEEKPQAPWPTIEEMREEGDERATSEFGRFPGVPRMPGNETVAWRARLQLAQYSMDEVWRSPCKETYEAARRQSPPEEMEEMEALLGKELVDALDCKTYDDF